MKTKIMCVAALLSGVTLSCSQDDLLQSHDEKTLQNVSVAVPDTTLTVTSEHIRRIVDSRKQTRAGVREIKEIIPINTDTGIPLLYVVNFKNKKGFIIISATKDYLPVLAYSESGEFNLSLIQNTGTSLYFDDFKFLTSTAFSLPDSIKNTFRSMWENYSTLSRPLYVLSRSSADVASLIGSHVREWQENGYTVYTVADYKNTMEYQQLPEDARYKISRFPYGYGNGNYGPPESTSFVLRKEVDSAINYPSFVTTTWKQSNGFNKYTPYNYPAGCVAVAVCQILKYNEFPLSYDWDAMDDRYPTEATQRLLADVGSDLKTDYGADGSSSTIDDAVSTFRRKGYTGVKKIKHDGQRVLKDIKNRYPVFMKGHSDEGNGHAWVCDGAYGNGMNTVELKLMTLENCPETVEPTCFLNPFNYSIALSYSPLYFHMNWGWGENGANGYYNDADIKISLSSGDRNYRRKREDIINIQPNK